MRLALITAVVMVAFAANSVLNRAAVGAGEIDPLLFAVLRLGFGAAALWAFVGVRRRFAAPTRRALAIGSLSLLAYMIGFSLAYLRLDAGLGALILFGGVQVTMFAGAVVAGGRPGWPKWAGSGLALAGLAWLFLPGGSGAADPVFALAMAAAAVGWGVYSLNGRGAVDPLGATAANFAIAAVLAAPLLAVAGAGVGANGTDVALAAVSGIVTSGMGYALWYAVLPRLETTAAALSQLTVPVIAIAGGALLLGEPVGARVVLGAALVLGGVAFGLLAGRRS